MSGKVRLNHLESDHNHFLLLTVNLHPINRVDEYHCPNWFIVSQNLNFPFGSYQCLTSLVFLHNMHLFRLSHSCSREFLWMMALRPMLQRLPWK